jgi:uncharacterized protein
MHEIEDIGPDAYAQSALLALNNANALATSLLDATTFAKMIEAASVATMVKPAAAFLLAFDQTSAYNGGHFVWFRDRIERFVYIDRIIVSADVRRSGIARLLYDDLFVRAARTGCATVTCEVNISPPNPISDAFHARLGFQPVGAANVPGSGKTVRYLLRHSHPGSRHSVAAMEMEKIVASTTTIAGPPGISAE